MQAATQEEIELLLHLEELNRQRARDDLNEYCKFIEMPGAPLKEDSCELGDDCDDPKCTKHEVSNSFYHDKLEPAKHHRLINDVLMKVAYKEVCERPGLIDPVTNEEITNVTYKNVMVFMPPGSAKSTYGTVSFPSWYMGKFKRKNIITATYATGLARKFGRKVRSITQSKEFVELFPDAMLDSSNRAVHDWSLMNQSTYMTAGILAGITGNRADGIVIDDPVKGAEEADSQNNRDKIWDEWLLSIRSRVKPGGFKVIIQTRWHEDDLSGRILPETYDGESGWILSRDGEPWYVICLQAQCERDDDPLGREIGEWLWTEWFDEEHWEQEKRSQIRTNGGRNWAALYQQRPKPAEGALIKRAWPNRYAVRPPAFSRIAFSLDTAYKPEQINDPSVLGIWGELREGHYLLDVWRERVDYTELKRVLLMYWEQWRPNAILIEDKASGQSLIQECRNKTSLPVIPIDTEGQNKQIRLIQVSPEIESRRLWLPESAPWLPEYERELFGFPLSTHDDQVDMTSQYFKWTLANRGNFSAFGTGDLRQGYTVDNEHKETQTGNDYGVGSMNDFGGFI